MNFVQTCLRDAAAGLERTGNALAQVERLAEGRDTPQAKAAAKKLAEMRALYEADRQSLTEIAEKIY